MAYKASPVNRARRTKAQLAAVDAAIVAAVQQDSPVTLRGVYYRVVSAGAVDKTEAGYELVGRELLKLRRNGSVSYADIVDGTRTTTVVRSYDSAEDALRRTASTYRQQLWADQDCEVMFVTEKDAISGVVSPVTNRWQVPLTVLRGYASESTAWAMAQSVKRVNFSNRSAHLYQLGDHDPSGVDAWRSFVERVRGFLRPDWPWSVTFERLAVTPEQIESLSLPTRPTKSGDTRAKELPGRVGGSGRDTRQDAAGNRGRRHHSAH